MNILDKLVAATRIRVERQKKQVSPECIRERCISLPKGIFTFRQALAGEEISFICEVKKASPSKGIIAESFEPLLIAKEYEAAGADCLSVLTEPDYFLGDDRYLQEISAAVSIPALRKDFIIDSYQIYQAKLLGAKAVLLICSILNQKTLYEYQRLANELGMDALVEVHDSDEMQMAAAAEAAIIGVNNRNLKTFEVDIANSIRLRELAPADILFVSESGIKGYQEVKLLAEAGVSAILVGESLMRCTDKKQALSRLRRGYD